MGGSGDDLARTLTVDDAGAAYVLGFTSSPDLPTTPQSLPRTTVATPTSGAAVIAKLSPGGQSLVYASFLSPALLPSASSSNPALYEKGGLVMWAHPSGSGPYEVWTLAPDGSRLDRSPALPNASTSDAAAFPVNGLGIDPEDRNRLYAATDAGLLLSQDNGWTWTLVRPGTSLAIAVDPFDSNRLYLGADGIYLSTDGGQTWRLTNNAPARSFTADPSVPGLLYALSGPVYRSADGGKIWSPVWTNPFPFSMPSFSFAIALRVHADPANPGQAYIFGYTSCNMCAGNQYWILRSIDQGGTWNPVPNSFVPLLPPYNNGAMGTDGDVDPSTGDMYAIYHGQLVAFRGGNFTKPGVALNLPPVSAFQLDPANTGRIYIELSDFSVIESDDQGATWSPVGPAYLNGGYLHSAAPAGGQVFIAGTTTGGLDTANAFQNTFGGGTSDAFVASFNEEGVLLWSTYLGGSDSEFISQVLPLPDGSAIVVGTTGSPDFPMLQSSFLGPGTTFIAHIHP